MPIVNVKWGKEKYSVDVDTAVPPMVFKTQLFTLTQVLPERQKVMVMGRTLGDDTWDGINIKDNMTIMMMGSTGDIPKAPVAQETSNKIGANPEDEVSSMYPCGLANLGNTCYFNSCIQLLKEVNELQIKPSDESKIAVTEDRLAITLSKLFGQLRNKGEAIRNRGDSIKPFIPVLTLSERFPQFEKLKQQDANECFVAVLNNLIQNYERAGFSLDRIFNVETLTHTRCLESEETTSPKREGHNQLTCYVNQDVRFLQTGIKSGFDQEVLKHSQELGRDAKWQSTTQVSRLPKYLTVNINRFFYKGGSQQTNAKILKQVTFPMSLDAYDLCTPELKEKLSVRRADIKLEEDAKLERELRKKVLDKEQGEKIFDDGIDLPTEFEEDPGSNNTGGIITHKGRSSNDGHYVAWVKSVEDGKWRLFDDEHVTIVDEEAIMKTSGGGDWHCAYVLLYQARVVKKYPVLPPAPVPSEAVTADEPMEVSNQ